MRVECGSCSTLVEASDDWSYMRFNAEVDSAPRHTIFVICSSCQAPNVYEQDWLDLDADGFPVWDDEIRRIYPPADRGLSKAAPEPVRESFAEARKCFRVAAYTAATLMAVRALEAICAERGTNRKNLNEGLKELLEAGEIDNRLFEWADSLRDIRNEAAHTFGAPISQRDADDVLGFTEAIVDYMYVYRRRFEEFMERRKKRSESSDAN